MFSQCVQFHNHSPICTTPTISTNIWTHSKFSFCLSLCALQTPLHRKNINKIVNMPKINRENYTIEWFFTIEIDVRIGENEIKRMCCSCLSIADQWRLKNSTKGMKTIFIKSYVIWKWRIFTDEMKNFHPSLSNFGVFSWTIKGRFLLCKHRYESALFQLLSGTDFTIFPFSLYRNILCFLSQWKWIF